MTCWSSVRSRVARITRLDECGRALVGACSLVFDGYISIEYEMEIKEGEEIEVVKANGELCVSDKACDELKWINVTLSLCQVNPDLLATIAGYEAVTDFAGENVGNRIGKDILCDGGFALEAWTDVPGQPCTTTGGKQYGYFLLPWMKNAIITGFTLENDAATFEITARTQDGSLWGVGPYAPINTNGANPPLAGPLATPIGPEDHLHMQLTTVAPPVVSPNCECVPLP